MYIGRIHVRTPYCSALSGSRQQPTLTSPTAGSASRLLCGTLTIRPLCLHVLVVRKSPPWLCCGCRTITHRALSDVLVNLEVFKHLAALLLKLEKGCNLSADQLAAQFLEERLPSALPRQPSSTRSLAPASLGTPIDQQQQQQYNQSAGPVTAAAAHGHQPAQQGLQQDHPLTQREAQPPQDMQVAENAAERVHQAAAQQEAAGMQADAAVHQHQQQQPDSPQVSSEAILAQQPQQEAAGGSNVITMLQQMQEMLRRGDCSQAEIIWLGQQLMASAEANGAPAAADEHAERVVSFLDSSSSSSSLGSRTLSSTAGSSSGPDSQPRSPSATGSSRDSPRRVRTGGSSSSSSFLSFIAADSNSLGPLDPEVVEAGGLVVQQAAQLLGMTKRPARCCAGEGGMPQCTSSG